MNTERPHTLENVTLADWAAWYDVRQKPNTVEPRLSGHAGTAVKSPDNRESG